MSSLLAPCWPQGDELIDLLIPLHACRHDRIEAQRGEVEQRRLQLSTTLEQQIADPYRTAGERRAAAGLLATADNKPWAHQKLLDAHSAQLRQQQDALSKPQNTSRHTLPMSVWVTCGCATPECLYPANHIAMSNMKVVKPENRFT